MSRNAPAATSGGPVRVVRIIARLNVGGPAWHVVLLSAGSLVPADAVVLEATDFFVNEAVLTGESFPV